MSSVEAPKNTPKTLNNIPFNDFGFKITDDGIPTATDLLELKSRKITNPSLIKNERHLRVLSNIFKDELEYNYNELKNTIMQEFGIGRDASEKFISHYLDKNWITKEQRGKYSIYKFNSSATSFFYNPN